MATRHIGSAAEPTYASYLELDRLLGLQSPLSAPVHPDELHFIVTHQVMELWFKVMVHEIQQAKVDLENREWSPAATRIERVNAVLEAQIVQMGTLRFLDPAAFLGFRDFLGSASGAQSEQFRVLEVLSGLRTSDYLAMLRRHNGGQLPAGVIDVLDSLSLAEVAGEVPAKAGVGEWVDIYARPGEHGLLFLLGERLLDYDSLWMRWRHEHLMLTERIIGHRTSGTGGGSAGYLAGRIPLRFFPFLWDARDQLVRARATQDYSES